MAKKTPPPKKECPPHGPWTDIASTKTHIRQKCDNCGKVRMHLKVEDVPGF